MIQLLLLKARYSQWLQHKGRQNSSRVEKFEQESDKLHTPVEELGFLRMRQESSMACKHLHGDQNVSEA